MAAAFSLPWGYFENIFRVAGYLRISLGYIGGGCIDPNAMGGVMWRLHSGCFFRTSLGYQDILGITLGYSVVIIRQKTKCIEPGVALCGGYILAALGLFWEYLWDIGIS